MDSSKTKARRFSKLIEVFLLFILCIIPLIYLHFYFAEQSIKIEKINSELAKEKLLTEMTRVQEELVPENYIEKAFASLEQHLGIPDLSNERLFPTDSNESKQDYIDKNFIKNSKEFLKEKYGIEPFFMLSLGRDLENLNVESEDNIFPNQEDKNDFIYSIIDEFFIKTSISKSYFAKNSSNYKNINNKIETALRKGKSYETEFARNISIFSKAYGMDKQCLSFYSNKFGNQRSYQYHNSFILNRNNSIRGIIGYYYACIKASEISIEKILNNVFYNENKSHIIRTIQNEATDVPVFGITQRGEYFYKSPFPSHLFNLIADQKVKNTYISDKFREFFNNHSINIILDDSANENPYIDYQKKTDIFSMLFIAFFALICINKIFGIIKLKQSLSKKIRYIVLIAVILPLIGIWIISHLTYQNIKATYLNNCQKIISARFSLFNKILEDEISYNSIHSLRFKKYFSDRYYQYSPETFYKTFAKEALDSNWSIYAYLIPRTTILDKYGNIGYKSNLGFKLSERELVKLSPIYRLVTDINMLDPNSKANQRNQQQIEAITGFGSNYVNNFSSSNLLAQEGYLLPNRAMNIRLKNTTQLVASKENPYTPTILLDSDISMSNSYVKLFKVINSKYTSLLSYEDNSCKIEFAISNRSEMEIIKEIDNNAEHPFKSYLLENTNKALKNKNSGTETIEKEKELVINSWQYSNDNQIILSAVAIMPRNTGNYLNSYTLALVLFIYSFLVICLLADLLSEALLSPIKALSGFVDIISNESLNVATVIETGDELQELGETFNQMSEGLCENEKMKRFVSDKLLQSIKNDEENRIKKAKVTILSSDIRSFTTISEQNSPETVVSLLNDYFTIMQGCIVKYGGSVEKIVGDAISAAFYEDQSPEYALNACKAALEMRKSLKIFNEERSSEELFTIENGIGISTGEVIIGFAGRNSRRREFLLIGKILKEAENLESMTKTAESSKVYIDKETFEEIKGKIALCPQKNSDVYFRELKL